MQYCFRRPSSAALTLIPALLGVSTNSSCDGDAKKHLPGQGKRSALQQKSNSLVSKNLTILSSCSREDTADGKIKDEAIGGLETAVGNTPLILLRTLSEATGCKIYGKAEFLNPTASVKDRAAKNMIEEAEKAGLLKAGGTIFEGTGGNTGISLAQIGRAKGYKVVLCMPNSISTEKIEHQRRFGAEVHLQPLVPFTDPRNYARHAEILARERKERGESVLFTNQFENLANYRAHYYGTGPEIWRQTNGQIDAFVTSAGTGGTIAGISAYLKGASPTVICYLVDPSGSVLFSYVKERKAEIHNNKGSMIEGIGIGRITANFNEAVLDDAFGCSDQEAVDMAYYLMRHEGIFVGPSAALNVVGAVKAAKRLGPGKTIVTILCDSGDRYLSKLYNSDWLAKENLSLPDASGSKKGDLSFVS